MRSAIAAAAAAAALSLVASPAVAGPTLVVNGSGQLTGATGVVVNGSSYNVEFVEGTCAGLFGGCDSNSDFAFQSQADAESAAQALLDQVFTGPFDTDYTLTFGCSSNGGNDCQAVIPFAIVPLQDLFSFESAQNTDGASDGIAGGSSDPMIFDTTDYAEFVFARFTPAAVPEPASWALMLVGFAAIGFALRRESKDLFALG